MILPVKGNVLCPILAIILHGSLSLYWCMYTGSSDDQYVRHWIDDCYRLGYRYIYNYTVNL